jgi:hypothetical protein
MQEDFYLQSKAFLEKNSEHIKENARLKAEVERLTKAGNGLHQVCRRFEYLSEVCKAWEAAKEGKQS